MTQRLLVTISIICGFNIIVAAQDTVTYDVRAIAPFIQWDYGKTATIWTAFETKHEFGAGVLLFDKIELLGEYGLAQLTPRNAFGNIDYTVDGEYWRLGVAYLANIDPRNRIGLGIKYGSSSFTDTGTIRVITSTDYNTDYERTFSRDALSSTWGEVNLITQRKVLLSKEKLPSERINQLFSLGAVFRYRWLLTASKIEEVPNYYSIPGYGRANSSSLLAVNLFLKIYIR